MATIRPTAAQALVRYLTAQWNEDGQRLFHGVWAIFGHGNVAALGEALHAYRDELPTFRDGLHELDRSWREQHGDRRRRRARESLARAVPAG